MKRISEAHTSPDAFIHQDSPVHSTASGHVHCGSKCMSVHHDLEISVSDEDETCIPSPTALPDQRDITSSLATEVAQCYFHSAQGPASGIGYKHSTEHDIKSHPPDEVGLNSPHSSVNTVSPKGSLSADKLARAQCMNSHHNLCPTLYTDEKVEGLSPIGNKAISDESTHQPMVSPPVNQGSSGPSPTNAQSCVSSGCADQSSLLSNKSLGIPMSNDENAHHVDPHNPHMVPPPTSMATLSPTTEKLYDLVHPGIISSHFPGTKSPLARAAGFMTNDICLACEVPNRYMVHCCELYPESFSQVDVSCDVLGESDSLLETASDVSEYMLHETRITDTGYHSPHPMIPTHVDVSSGTVVPGYANKVPCPFSQDETLVSLPGEMDEILSQVLCEDTGHLDVKLPGQVLPLARASGENVANVASMFSSFAESETFIEPNYLIPCNPMVDPIEEKMLPFPNEFPSQSMTANHPIGVDEDLEDYVCQIPTHVQHISTYDPGITSPNELLNWPRLVRVAKDQPQ